MAISTFFGFEPFRTLQGHSFSIPSQMGDLPFIGDDTVVSISGYYSEIRNDSTFRIERFGGRTWMRSITSTTSRMPISSCYSVSAPTGYWRRERSSSPAQVAQTNRNRYLDSLGRTPTLYFSFRDVFGDWLDDNECRFFTMGFRVKYLNGDTSFNGALLRMSNVGVNNHQGGHTLFPANIPLDENDEAYVELTLDRKFGEIRRWVNDTPIAPLTMPPNLLTTFNDLHFYINKRSSSTAGVYQSTTQRSSWSGTPVCPVAVGSSTDSAPPECRYALTDFYFMVDSRHVNDDMESVRLGPVEVERLELKEVLLNRYWTPNGNEDPTETLSRLKITNNPSQVPSISGDRRSDPLTIEFSRPTIDTTEQIDAMKMSVFGHSVGNSPKKVQLQLQIGNRDMKALTKELPNGTISHGTDVPQHLVQRVFGSLDPESFDSVLLKLNFPTDTD